MSDEAMKEPLSSAHLEQMTGKTVLRDPDPEILFIVPSDSKSLIEAGGVLQQTVIRQSALKAKLNDLVANLEPIMGSIDRGVGSVGKVGEYEIDQIELYVTVTAQGSLAVVGAGGEAGIKLVLRKPIGSLTS